MPGIKKSWQTGKPVVASAIYNDGSGWIDKGNN